jgi:predicted ATPase/class 3 adenylate cyclase
MGSERRLASIVALDVAGYSARTEADEAGTVAAVAALRGTIERIAREHSGRVFNTAGDGFMLEFGSSAGAVEAALALAETCEPKVRVGVHLGDIAVQPNGDLLGHGVNVAARLMAQAGPGSALVSSAVRQTLRGPLAARLVSRGMLHLDKMNETIEGFVITPNGSMLAGVAPGMPTVSKPFARTASVRGNLPSEATSFVGREGEMSELSRLAREHRLVTLTGVGGVGKTRLALRVASELVAEFADGAWLIELAPVSDPAAVADSAATALGITLQSGRSASDAIVEALSGRRLLIVLDNCEHVLGAAADLAESLLTHTTGVTVIATSREGLRLGAEHLWPVPSLSIREGTGSAAVRLFMQRAHAVKPTFSLSKGAETEAVTAICERLDGIALAIELAAARMVSMSPAELLARLTDRFRLLSGPRRGLERHQTLRQAVQWSYDLLAEDEKQLLGRCAVFAGGFDLTAATDVCGEGLDEYIVLDLLDSLVRKSLVNAEPGTSGTRYSILETIRQFAEEQLAAANATEAIRDRHARYFAREIVRQWEEVWPTPRVRAAHDWVDIEFFNLREGFRWAADRAGLDTAAAIAAHAGALLFFLQRYEPVQWAEEILESATRADIKQLPRLYVCACFTNYTGGPTDTVTSYARKALSLADDPRYDPFAPYWSLAAPAWNLFQRDSAAPEPMTVFRRLADGEGLARVLGLFLTVWALAGLGRETEARELDEASVAAAQAEGQPITLASAQWGLARARLDVEPERARNALQSALALSRAHRAVHHERICLMEIAHLEGLSGDPAQALIRFDEVIDFFLRSGDHEDLDATLGYLAMLLDRCGRPEVAVTLYGASHGVTWAVGLLDWVDRAREALGAERFDACLATGASMTIAETAAYARAEIANARKALTAAGPPLPPAT